jgi:hypothetical protein
MEENKQILKEKFERGKSLGIKVTETRNKINAIKNEV